MTTQVKRVIMFGIMGIIALFLLAIPIWWEEAQPIIFGLPDIVKGIAEWVQWVLSELWDAITW